MAQAVMQFVRENLMCSSDDPSPKHEVQRRVSKSVCCGGGGPPPRRPGELIATTSTVGRTSQQPAGNHRDPGRRGRTPSPLRTGRTNSPLRAGSGGESFRTQGSSWHSALGVSMPFSGAAMGLGDMGGGGLYVPMQRGLGPRGPPQREPNRQLRDSTRYGNDSYSQGDSSVGFSVRASNYVAQSGDVLDNAVEAICKQLPVHISKAVAVRRLKQAEYEVNGRPVQVCMHNREVIVVYTNGRTESFSSYLRRSGDFAIKNPGAAKTSFDDSDEGTGVARLASSAASWAAPQNGSFLVRSSEGGSFLLNRTDMGPSFTSHGGSFYQPAGPHPSSVQVQVHRQNVSGASFYMRPGAAVERSASSVPSAPSSGYPTIRPVLVPPPPPQPRTGGLTPPRPSMPRMQTQTLQGLACSPAPSLVYAPHYITAGGA